MGLCATKDATHLTVEAARNKRIDLSIRQDKAASGNQIKMLLLGSGESGKSTIFRQMKIIHMSGFTPVERASYAPLIRRHCVENFADLVAGADHLGLLSVEEKARFDEIFRIIDSSGLMNADVEPVLAAWQSKSLQKAFANKAHFQLADWAHYFFDSLSRVAQATYTPTDEDILRCRIRTAGVSELEFCADGVKFRLVDVGGQRNERRKWIHCFEGVQAVIFVAAISEYDQTIFEDNQTNRITESLRLFREICSTRFFLGTPIILFLNKRDLLQAKLPTSPLDSQFPEYTGGSDVNAAISFLTAQFTDTAAAATANLQDDGQGALGTRAVYTHVTCAVSTDNVSFVFAAVKDAVVTDNLECSGFV